MAKQVIESYAKLNLSLLVWPPKADGYHPICSVFQTISLFDTIEIKKTDVQGDFTLTCTDPDIPVDEGNLLTAAFMAYKDKIPFGLSIHLKKNIPSGAGLGGGSSNIAAFLMYLNEEAGWHYSEKKLMRMGAKFGADVPFFIQGGTALVRGVGEKIKPLPRTILRYYVLISPNIHSNTALAYKAYDLQPTRTGKPTKTPQTLIKHHLGPNDLKSVIFSYYPDLKEIEKIVEKLKGPPVFMTGSGSTLFLPFRQKKNAVIFAEKLSLMFPDFLITTVRPNLKGHRRL